MRSHTPFVLAAALVASSLGPARLSSQEGDTWTVIGGAALGLFSGSVLGTVGGVMPCGYALNPSMCSTTFALSGAVLAAAAGAHIGNVDRSQLGDIAKTAAIGAGVGVILGAAIKPFMKQYYGFEDILAIGMVGAAVGASPKGSAIGFGLGLAAGSFLWLTVEQATTQDVLQTALLGLAVGGISGWASNALQAELVLPMSLAF
jgi:hypothetical protein